MATKGQNRRKGKNKQAYAPKPKIPPPPKRKDPAKDSICHEYGKIGHWKRNYPQYLVELLKKKKNAASGAGGSGIFVIELNTILNSSWIYDTGCGTYICNTTQDVRASRKLKLGAFSLYDGFINRFMDNTIQVSRNNMVYFSSIPRDGIFEIDLSNSLTNESSIYAISNKRAKQDLDYALLWHCRLGHISKKCIDKLKNDGLLESFDLIARKPYTHQVERAKDLLGLIHTDHKHEVFETFKVFQKEVENQLGLQGHAPDRMCLYIDADEHELGDLGEPTNYKAALLDRESEKWINSINMEMQSMKYNEVWILVELPPNGKTVDSKWLFKKKTNMDGNIHTYKARLVAKGYTQTPVIDYEDTFSPVADIRDIRILIAIATYYDYEIWKMDVKTAFLNRYLNEKVYMKQPEGLVNPKYPNRRYCMKNSKCGSIPMQEKLKLSKSQGASTPTELKRMQNVPYASAVGSIMYAVRCTRPDVAFAQDTGYVFILNGGAVDWKSAKQRIFTTSSAEAEYIVAFDASKEVVWVRKFISGLGVVPTIQELINDAEYIAAFDALKEAVWIRKFIYGLGIVPTIEEPISMYCDNTRAIAIAKDNGITKGARYFRAKIHYLRETIKLGDVKIEKVDTCDNLADPFTKALVIPKHSKLTRNIGMLSASSF
nr:retrotransposon protein, putative, Ty1-copia subclass [Tanacetum cinerariifolium]